MTFPDSRLRPHGKVIPTSALHRGHETRRGSRGMPKSDVRRIFDAAAELGFPAPELRSGGHYATSHPDTSETVFFPATPSDNRGIDNVISQLQRVSGRRLSKQRGYSGGQRFSPDQPVDMHSRTLAELHSADQRQQFTARIEELDADLRDIVERIDLGRLAATPDTVKRLRGLLTARDHYAGRLRDHLGTVPELDIDGLDALVSTAADDTPATAADLDQLRSKFSD